MDTLLTQAGKGLCHKQYFLDMKAVCGNLLLSVFFFLYFVTVKVVNTPNAKSGGMWAAHLWWAPRMGRGLQRQKWITQKEETHKSASAHHEIIELQI